MKLELITVLSTDMLELPGALYSPNQKSKKAAIFLHGNGDSGVFYNLAMINALGGELANKGIAFLAFNNRGARYKKKLIVAGSGEPGQEDRALGGAHYELIEDCIKDIDGAIELLGRIGYEEFYLIGFSTGANKICVYDKAAKSNIKKYVHAGPGDDSGLFYNELGDKRFWLSLRYAEQAINQGSSLKIMPKYTGMNPFSAQSAYDILNPDGPYNTFPYFESSQKRLGKKKLFEEYQGIKKPMLVIFGANDEFTYTGGSAQAVLSMLRNVTNKKALPKSDFQIISGANHGFHGAEAELARNVAVWLSS